MNFKISKKTNKKFSTISALASKDRSYQKMRALYTTIAAFYFDSLTLLF